MTPLTVSWDLPYQSSITNQENIPSGLTPRQAGGGLFSVEISLFPVTPAELKLPQPARHCHRKSWDTGSQSRQKSSGLHYLAGQNSVVKILKSQQPRPATCIHWSNCLSKTTFLSHGEKEPIIYCTRSIGSSVGREGRECIPVTPAEEDALYLWLLSLGPRHPPQLAQGSFQRHNVCATGGGSVLLARALESSNKGYTQGSKRN